MRSWFNFKTNAFEDRERPVDFSDYIPQEDAAQSLYKILVDKMDTLPVKAAEEILRITSGGISYEMERTKTRSR